MRQVTIQAARTSLPALIEAALAGEDIVIVKKGKPVVRLVPVPRRAFKLNLLDGQLGAGPDFFKPMDESDLALWESDPSLEG